MADELDALLVRVGASVALRDDPKSITYEVLGIDAGRAALQRVRQAERPQLSLEEEGPHPRQRPGPA